MSGFIYLHCPQQDNGVQKMKKIILIAIPILLALALITPKENVSGEVIHVSADDMIYDTIDNGFYEIKVPKAEWKYKSDSNIKVIFGRYDGMENNGIIAYIIKELDYPYKIDFGNNETQQTFLETTKIGLNETELIKMEGEKDRIEFVLNYFDSGSRQWITYADISFLCGEKLVKFTTKAMDSHTEQLIDLNSEIISGFKCKISLD